jgi:hypothetical protein
MLVSSCSGPQLIRIAYGYPEGRLAKKSPSLTALAGSLKLPLTDAVPADTLPVPFVIMRLEWLLAINSPEAYNWLQTAAHMRRRSEVHASARTRNRPSDCQRPTLLHRPMLSFVHLSCMPAHRSRTSHPSTAAEDGCYLFRRMSIGGPLQSSGPRQSGCSCAETRGSPPISDLPDSVTGGCEPLNDLAFPDHRINRATASIRTAN